MSLHYLQLSGIVHHDLKSANIMYSENLPLDDVVAAAATPTNGTGILIFYLILIFKFNFIFFYKTEDDEHNIIIYSGEVVCLWVVSTIFFDGSFTEVEVMILFVDVDDVGDWLWFLWPLQLKSYWR